MSVQEIVEAWANEAGFRLFKRAIVVHVGIDEIHVISDRPGLLIGYRGELVNKYSIIFKENGYTQNIDLVDTSIPQVKVLE